MVSTFFKYASRDEYKLNNIQIISSILITFLEVIIFMPSIPLSGKKLFLSFDIFMNS